MGTPESNSKNPLVGEFMRDPAAVSREIISALESGNLDKDFAQKINSNFILRPDGLWPA